MKPRKQKIKKDIIIISGEEYAKAQELHKKLMDENDQLRAENLNLTKERDELKKSANNIAKMLEEYKAKYNELLYAVANKYEGESRHETALRYIKEAENSSEVVMHDCNSQVIKMNGKIESLEAKLRVAEEYLTKMSATDCWRCHDLHGNGFNNHIESGGCFQHEAMEALKNMEEIKWVNIHHKKH